MKVKLNHYSDEEVDVSGLPESDTHETEEPLLPSGEIIPPETVTSDSLVRKFMEVFNTLNDEGKLKVIKALLEGPGTK